MSRFDRNNRMAAPQTRQPSPAMQAIGPDPVPVERKIVCPPPESRIACRHCGATRWHKEGMMPRGEGWVRKRCLGCGAKWAISPDQRLMRLLG
jgi:hypothetical protein